MKRLSLAAGLGLLALAQTPAVADADTYTVHSCRTPLGLPAAASGWTAAQSGTGAVSDTCSTQGALSGVLADAVPAGNASASWRFDAPPGTRIVRVNAARSTTGLAKSERANDLAYTLETDGATLERCAPSTESSCVADLVEPVAKEGIDAAWLRFRALCTNAGDVCSGPLRFDVASVSVGLADRQPPAVAAASVVDDGDVSGRLRLRFDAADVGGGLYRTLVKVDGKPGALLPLAAGPCTDANPANADAYEFLVPVPCPAALTAAGASVDVRALPPGPHAVEVAVEDAAGNAATVYGPLEFPKANITGSSVPTAQLLNAKLRMWFVKGKARVSRLTSRYGRRVVTRGTLRTRSGRGVQGARIDVYHVRNGRKRLLKTGLKTRAKGELTLILPNDVDSRRIQFVYRAVRPGPATSTRSLRLTVRDSKGRIYRRR